MWDLSLSHDQRPWWLSVFQDSQGENKEKWVDVPATKDVNVAFLSELDGNFTLKDDSRRAFEHFGSHAKPSILNGSRHSWTLLHIAACYATTICASMILLNQTKIRLALFDVDRRTQTYDSLPNGKVK